MKSKKLLQLILGALVVIPFITSTIAIYEGLPLEAYSDELMVADSAFRYRAGIYFGFALTLLYSIINIEKVGPIFKFLCISFFIGGIARVVSMLEYGIPNAMILGFTILEFAIVLFIPWQQQIRNEYLHSTEHSTE